MRGTMVSFGGTFQRVFPLNDIAPRDVLSFADELNGLPRRRLDYSTPEELFETFLDAIYAA